MRCAATCGSVEAVFTGIVTAIGVVAAVERRGDVRRVTVATDAAADAAVGASIACAGVCLTLTEVTANGFCVDVGLETLARSTVADWKAGTRLNLERSLKAGDEFGGHLVTGHIDGVAIIADRTNHSGTVTFRLHVPPELARFIAAKGSVALDGTSLTVNAAEGNAFDCHLIPHTLAVTTWAERRPGDRVNIEVDLIARYLARLMAG